MVSKKRPRVILFPTLDFLSRYQQEKKLKQLAGKVVVYNMYDDIINVPSIKELEAMEQKQAERVMQIVRDKHTVKLLCKHWKVSSYAVYNKVFPKYGIMSKPKVPEVKAIVTSRGIGDEPTISLVTGFQIALDGDFVGGELSERLLRLDALISKDGRYSIQLTITEQ